MIHQRTFNHEEKLNLSLVIPVFNEEDTIDLFIKKIDETFKNLENLSIELIFINDGSTDKTLTNLLLHQENHTSIKIVDLSRNFGKEAALSAGLKTANGDVVIPIDVDLQDPPELIYKMIEKWREGYDVVLGRRINRDSDSWAKRISAICFYRIHNMISRPKIPENVGDFRLMDRCVVKALNELPESCRFMKGLFSWIGFETACVDYSRPERIAGSTKFNGWKLWNFALEGLTSFSSAPLRIWTYIGLFVSSTSFIFAMFILLKVMISGADVPGYASIMVAVTFLGGLQLIGIGVLGEYLSRTYIESKRRPTYLIRNIYKSENP